jgi:hypothetical protein
MRVWDGSCVRDWPALPRRRLRVRRNVVPKRLLLGRRVCRRRQRQRLRHRRPGLSDLHDRCVREWNLQHVHASQLSRRLLFRVHLLPAFGFHVRNRGRRVRRV